MVFGNTRGQGPRLSIRSTGSNIFVFVRDVTHVQTCEKKRFFFFFRFFGSYLKHVQILWWRSCSKYYAIDCFGTELKHVQCPDLWWRSCSKCYATDCFGTDLEHVQTCDDVCVQSATQTTASCRLDNMSSVQTCDGVPVQSATQPTASVQTWNMSKPVMTFVFKVLRNRLLRADLTTCPVSRPVMAFLFKVLRNRLVRYILETCPNLWWRSCSKCYAIDCFGTWHMFQTCDYIYGSFTHVWHFSGSLVAYALQPCKNDVYLVHNDEIPMGTAWFRARATKDPKRGCLGYKKDYTTQLCWDYIKPS